MKQSHINIPVKTTLFIRLVDFLRDEGSDRDPVETVELAIDYWIDNAGMKPEDLMPEIAKNETGYSWKHLFLPHSTKIRMRYKGEYYYAKVDGDQVIYDGKVITPSEFANTVAKSSRNAWKCLEIKLAHDNEWVSADLLRENDSSRKLSFIDAFVKGEI